MPFGTDYGFGREVSYPIERILSDDDKTKEDWTLSIDVGKGVLWDIDEISLQIITKRKRYKTGFWVGAIIGGIIGWLIPVLLDFLFSFIQYTGSVLSVNF